MTKIINKQDAAPQDVVTQQEEKKQGNEELAIQQITTDPEIQVLLESLDENDGDFEITKEVMEQIMKKQINVHHLQSDEMYRVMHFMEDRQRSLETQVGTALAKLGRVESMLKDLTGSRIPDAARISQTLNPDRRRN